MKIKNNNETKNLLYIMINKTYSPVAKLTKKKREKERKKAQIPISRMKKWLPPQRLDIKRIVGEYYVQLYPHKFNNLDKIDQFLKKKKYTHTHIYTH